MAVSVGSRLGSYEILSPLGSGGMGQVWRARHLMLDRPAAVKLIRPEALGTGAGVQAKTLLRRFEREAQATSVLRSPHTIQVYDFGSTDDGTFYYAMELLEGRDLKSLVEQHGPLPAERVIYILRQVCESLAEAHRNGLIHRDIKPANIFLAEVGFKYDFVKVLDFGLVRGTPGSDWKGSLLTIEGAVAGTPAFMAPELIKGSSTIDERVDLYSLGCVACWLLTGQLVFEGDTPLQILAAHLEQQPVPPSARSELEIPTELERIVMACLEKDPDRRPQSVEALSRQLAECSMDEPWTEKRAEEWWRLYQPSKAPGERVSGESTTLPPQPSSAVEQGSKPRALPPRRRKAITARIRAVAVLPLTNLSRDPEQDYFADGMTDALITDLAKIGSLRVISRTSVMRYHKTDKSLPEIARELNVDTVVEGSVLRSGDRVRITAQLIDAATDQHLWAESYERDLRDILALQSEVAQAIAQEIKVKLTPREQARLASTRPVDPEAYQAYLKGRYYWNKFTEEGCKKSLGYFEQAIEKDPGYALAYAGLADSYTSLAHPGVKAMATGEAIPKAKAAAFKALKLDDKLAGAHASLAVAHFFFDWDWANAEREFQRAVELDPNNATVYQWYALYLVNSGRHEEAINQIRRAQELDPLSLMINTLVGVVFHRALRWDQAIEQLRRTLELDPNYSVALVFLGSAYGQKGMYEEAIAALQKATALSGGALAPKAWLGYVYAVSGRRDEAEKMLDEFKKLSMRREPVAMPIARIYLGLGEKKEALEWLEKAYEERDSDMVWLKTWPGFDNLRSDPRFQDLLRRMNFPK